MSRMILRWLRLKNFKGAKELIVEFNGEDTFIYGENGTKKSTIEDAHSWLWTHKNRLGQSTQKFDIKPLDEDNNVIHGLETEVEGLYEIDGKQVRLKKVYYEKWEKQRGSANKKFTGHTTDYYFNDMDAKKKKKVYDSKISELIDEETFSLLTNITYFNEQIHWKERREMLVDVCGDVTQEEVINQNPKLKEIKDFLPADRTLENHKNDVVKDKMSNINEELEKLPVRIDEVDNNLPDISELNEQSLKQEIEQLKEQKKEKEQELNRIKSGGEIAEKRKRISEIETELNKLKRQHNNDRWDKIEDLQNELSEKQEKVENLINQKRKLIKSKDSLKVDIKELENENDRLRQEFKNLSTEAKDLQSKEFDKSQFEFITCPDCGHEFFLDDIEKKKEEFNFKAF